MPPMGNKPNNPEDTDRQAALEQFEALLLDKYDYNFKVGSIIKGTIHRVDNDGAVVDLGAKNMGYLPGKEVAPPSDEALKKLNPGDEHEFLMLRESDEDGRWVVSLKRVYTAHSWQKLEDLLKDEQVVECNVAQVVKGGVLVDILGLRGFIPASHLRVRQPLDDMVGQPLKCKILSVDKARNNIILSHRKVVSEQMAEQRRDLFVNIEEGAIVEGEVVRLTDFGAFIDIGGVDGLLPLSQMSWRWVEHPSDILKVNDKVKVEVIGIDVDRQRVSLSIKSLHPDPWTEVTKVLGEGQEVEGTVTRVKHFGAFVEVYPGVEALLPSRDVTVYEDMTGSKLDSGVVFKSVISKFNPEERRISLTIIQHGTAPQEPFIESSMQ